MVNVSSGLCDMRSFNLLPPNEGLIRIVIKIEKLIVLKDCSFSTISQTSFHFNSLTTLNLSKL